MEVLTQAVEDRYLVEAYNKREKFNVYDTERVMQAPPEDLERVKRRLAAELTTRGILKNKTFRSLFWRYLKCAKKMNLLLFVEACFDCSALLRGPRQALELKRIIRNFLMEGSKCFIGNDITATEEEQKLFEEERQLLIGYIDKCIKPGTPESFSSSSSSTTTTTTTRTSDELHGVVGVEDETFEVSGLVQKMKGSRWKIPFDHCVKLSLRKMDEMIPPFLDSIYGQTAVRIEYFVTKGPLDHESFVRMRILGQGGFGLVHAVKSKHTGKLFAMKEMNKMVIIKKSRLKTVITEAKVLQRCNYPFVARLHQIVNTETAIFFNLEMLSGGELKYHLRRMQVVPLPTAQFWSACLVLGIAYLHSRNVMHRDLKLSNAILDSEGYVIISDFGLSVITDENEEKPRAKNCCGTTGYIAPEMILGPNWDKREDRPAVKRNSLVMSMVDSVKLRVFNPVKVYADPRKDGGGANAPLAIQNDKNAIAPAVPGVEELRNEMLQSRGSMRFSDGKTKSSEGKWEPHVRYKDYGVSVDWYALGVMMHQFYCLGRFPFSRGAQPTLQMETLVKNMLGGNIRWHDEALADCASNAKKMQKARDRFEKRQNKKRDGEAQPSPNRRQAADDSVPETPDFSSITGLTPEGRDLIQQLLCHDPAKRIGCRASGVKEIMCHPFFEGFDWLKLERQCVVPPFKPPSQAVNAEFNVAELENHNASKRQRKKTLKLTDEHHKKTFDELSYIRVESFYEELNYCDMDFEQTGPTKSAKGMQEGSTSCIIS